MIEIVDSFTRGGFVVYENSYTTVAEVSSVTIGIVGFTSVTDKLEVYYNGMLINLNHYSISGDDLTITLTGWSTSVGDVFDFRVYKNVR